MRNISLAIVHHAAADWSFEKVMDYHINTKGWMDIAYHYYIDWDPINIRAVLRFGRPLHKLGSHDKGQNEGSIGICLRGDWRSVKFDSNNRPVLEQINGSMYYNLWLVLTQLLEDLQRQGLVKKIEGHKENEPRTTQTECPGFNPNILRRYLSECPSFNPKILRRYLSKKEEVEVEDEVS